MRKSLLILELLLSPSLLALCTEFHFHSLLNRWIIFIPSTRTASTTITLATNVLVTLILSSIVTISIASLEELTAGITSTAITITNVTGTLTFEEAEERQSILPPDLFMADASPVDENEGHLVHSPPSLVKFKSSFNGVSLSDFDISSGVPRFTYVFDEKTIDPGTRLSLKCEATGNPLPQITWMLDDNAIFEHSRIRVGDYVTNNGYVNSFVNISSIRIEEGGLYTCTGELSSLSLSPLFPSSLFSSRVKGYLLGTENPANTQISLMCESSHRLQEKKRGRKKVM